ncbi:MAG: hypothetical protein HKN82_11585 [Akkermansiaceae bacterium]|nr:hypothetical protein [Akkermansiaceae bacterium]
MTRAAWIRHGSWAAVAVAAFGLGSVRSGDDPGSTARTGAVSKTESRASPGRASGGSGGMRAAKGGPGRAADQPRGPVAELFPLPGLPRSEREFDALARQAFQDGNPLARRAAFTRFLEAMTRENAPAMRKYLVDMNADKDQWKDFHYAWGSIDGEVAVKHAMDTREYDMEFTMSGWSSMHPAEAERFLKELTAAGKGENVLLRRGLVAGLADADRSLATAMIFDLAGAGAKNTGELLGIVTGKVLQRQGIAEAARWSAELPDGPLKAAAMDQVAHAYAGKDPRAAAQWAERFAGEDYASRVIEEVGDEWAKRNPAEAVKWLVSLDAGGGQNSGLRSALSRWAQRDPVPAGEHLARMARSPQRDAAINGYVRGLATKDPVGAIEWADSIANDRLRAEALTSAGKAYLQRNPAAARAWIAQGGLPAGVRKAVLKP